MLGGKLEEIDYDDLPEDGDDRAAEPGRLAGHHRQVLAGRRWFPTRRASWSRPSATIWPTARTATRSTTCARPMTVPPGQTIEVTDRLFAGAKEVELLDRYAERVRHPAVRPRGRFRLVLLPDQADVPRPPFLLPVDRQLRRGDPAADAAGQAAVLPARQQVLSGDEQDEEAAARDDAPARAVRRRQDAHEPGADGAVQEGEGQPDVGLPADRRADPGVLRAVQGAVRVDRDAPRAVLRLDPGPLGARSDLDLQPVRPAALGSAGAF